MGFNAGQSVAPLDWDFTDYNAGKGTSPEPTSQQINYYFRQSRNLVEALIRIQTGKVAAEAAEELDPEQAKQQLLDWAARSLEDGLALLQQELDQSSPPQETLELIEQMARLVAETTGNCPSADQIMALPHRVRMAYFGWFTQELTDPELVAAGTRRSLSVVRSG